MQANTTELTLIPTCLAIIWAVQWVTSPGGSVCVSATVCSCTVAGSRGIRDGRVLSHSSPSTPCDVNAGEKLHRRAGVKLHHGWMPDGLLRETSFCLLAVDVG